ncbi:MAG: DUF4159 domain-containing protein [Acidobacteriaceae bacterium]|nr:DUF4159 domain-containing protein [Acidobacteriaceae bacterium]
MSAVRECFSGASSRPAHNASGTLTRGWRSTPSKAMRSVVLSIVILLVVTAVAAAQFRRRFGGGPGRDPVVVNKPYDGQFTFTRLKYTTAPGGYWYQGLPSWAHGYPMSEDNLIRIMNEVTYLRGRTDAYNVFSLDDDELSKYPVSYITEAGWWTLNDQEAQAFRAYLEKGGFVIFDDFKVPGDYGPGGGGWDVFEENMKRIIPGAKFFEMSPDDPIFHCFFEIETLGNFPQAYNTGRPVFRGLYEDNDRSKRLMAIINYNTDVSQFWEWSGRGLRPFDETNEAYKLGVNYVMYGLTH